MKTLKYFLAGLVIFSISCTDSWDEHYKSETEGEAAIASPLNLLEYLKAQPKYTKFVEVLERTNVAEELVRDQYLTVWAVDNEGMEALSSLEMADSFVIKYHINNLSFSLSKLKDGYRLRALNGKYIPVKNPGTGSIQVANARIVQGNQFCQNGVVNEVSELMIPVQSIAEFLDELSEDFSIIRDSIFALNDTLFDPVNSIPVGVDKTGNTLYDSVFIIENPLFENADIASEFSQMTLLLPRNSVIEAAYKNLKSQYNQFGKPFTYADTMIAFNWIRDAVLYDKVIEHYGNEEDLISVQGKTWRTSVQKVNTEPRVMSNGLMYEVTKLKIPNNVHISKIKSLFHYYDFVPESQKPSLFTFTGATEIQAKVTDSYSFPSINVAGSYTILYLRGNIDDDEALAVDFTPVKLEVASDGTTTASPIMVPPGEYNLYMGFQAKNHPYINVYVNDELVASELNVEPATPWNYDRNNQTVTGTQYDGLGGLAGIVTIPGESMTTFTMKVEFALLSKGTVEELKLFHWALVPTENNY